MLGDSNSSRSTKHSHAFCDAESQEELDEIMRVCPDDCRLHSSDYLGAANHDKTMARPHARPVRVHDASR
ncbi:hypothetical protein BCR44DRAFT_41701 [Catenaria anguillulae PL171]|uniref:Uncharacterized protein n=1 Tax=Catenaria anguillulae PL171 TaxID=765915 RepID=A0A1Y2HCY8_9FUNG|nr:hypothetical protein BCR44DRAFT_41701 [Catenaria anguillulae PL171]